LKSRKPNRLGAGVRCVVSVSMLTEGWDANTVTHILGVRAFGSQLLCEQVVGRGLRRRSYAVNEDGMFEPEYAEVYGVPFSFIRVEGDPKKLVPRRTPVRVQALEDRADARIVFPRLDGYREEVPDGGLIAEFDETHQFRMTLDFASWTQSGGVVGQRAEHNLDKLRKARPQQVAFQLAKHLLTLYPDDAGAPRPWLFPDLVRISRTWLDECVTYGPDAFVGLFGIGEWRELAVERMRPAIISAGGRRPARITPIFRRYDVEGSTDAVDFFTTRKTFPTDPEKCHVNRVVLDGMHGEGNTWEQIVAMTLEALPQVAAYVKNDHLEFDIAYVHGGRTRRYLPDFLVRLARRDGDRERHLIVEVSGSFKTATTTMAAMTSTKAQTTRFLWCAAVTNHGGFGSWGFVEITDPATAREDLLDAIESLYADGPVTGLPT
jgi:type III restriction enzyme